MARREGTPKEVAEYVEDEAAEPYDVVFSAHHIIPGNEAFKRHAVLRWVGDKASLGDYGEGVASELADGEFIAHERAARRSAVVPAHLHRQRRRPAVYRSRRPPSTPRALDKGVDPTMVDVEPTTYYMLDAEDPDDIMLLRPLQAVGGTSWTSGQRFVDPVPQPLYVDIVEGYEVDTVPPVYTSIVPMMRDDLLECVRESGVDNIDAYPIVIRNRVTGEELGGYSAINIIGLVSAADAAGTVYSPDNPSRLIDADIDSLSIDPHRAGGFLLFRLAEAVTGVVVHEKVRRAVEARGMFPDLRFIHPKEWMA